MNLTNIISLFYVVFDVIILTVYYKIFLFEKNFKQPYIHLTIYLAAIGMYFVSSVCLPEAYQRTIVYLSVCFLLSFGYLGALTYKLILVAIYAAIGIIIENIVSFLLQIIEVFCRIKLTPDNGYILGTILSCVLFLAVTFCIWLVLKNKCKELCSQSRLTGSYLDTLFFVMIVITIVMSYGIHYLTLQQTMGYGLFFFLVLECLLIVFDIVIFFIFRKMELLEKRKLQAVYLEKVTQAQEEFYKESIQKNQKLKRLIHDEKNFLIGLAGLLQEQKVEIAINEI